MAQDYGITITEFLPTIGQVSTVSNSVQQLYNALVNQAAGAQTPQNAPVPPYNSLAVNNSTLSLRYPLDLPPYYMGFLFTNYRRPNIDAPIVLSAYKSVALPVPAWLQDHQHVVYSEAEQGTTLGYLADQAAKTLNSTQTSISNMDAATNLLQSGAQSIASSADAAAAIASAQLGQIGQTAAQLFGATPNPYLQVYFVSPSFKRHQFAWRFSPNNPAESTAMKNIVDTFRYAQLPSLGAGDGAFLLYPNIVYPYFSPNPQQMYLFRPCVIEDTSAQYAPNGVPVFMAGSQFAESIDLTISLLEIELSVKDNTGPGLLPGFLTV